MGKLYYITGKDTNTREKVYNEILKWSQAQQMNPMKSYPTPNNEVPNFYLYDYVGHGDIELLPQLITTYGENAVELIYLRLSNETEGALLQAGVFQSFHPYPNLAQCLQEIVETFFTGYQRTSYDFEEAWQAEKTQAIQEKEDALLKEQKAAEEAKKQKNKLLFKKWIKPGLILIAWVLLVCLVTVGIFHGINNLSGNGTKGGNLVMVTKPKHTPQNTTENSPAVTSKPTVTTEEVLFETTMPQDYQVDIVGPVVSGSDAYYYISYANTPELKSYSISCKEGNTAGDVFATSMDGTIGMLLSDSVLWYMNETGIHKVAEDVSDCALAANGTYIFYYSDNFIMGIDTKNNKKRNLLSASGLTGLVSSQNGNYCACLQENGDITIINRMEYTTDLVRGLDYITLYTVSNDGERVCARANLGGNPNYLLMQDTHGAQKWLTDEETDCYIPFSGENTIFEMMNQIWIFEEDGGYPMAHTSSTSDWRLIYPNGTGVYQVVDGVYLYDETAKFYIQNGDAVYQLKYIGGEYDMQLYADNIIYASEHSYLEELNARQELLSDYKKIISTIENSRILYVDSSNMLCMWSENYVQWNKESILDFSIVEQYVVAKDGTLYYFTSDGTLGAVKITESGYTHYRRGRHRCHHSRTQNARRSCQDRAWRRKS